MAWRRKAKIVCTIGPASNSQQILEKLIEGGMDVARLNFSHGDHDFHRDVIGKIRRLSKKLNKNTAILQDLQGIKIRVGKVKDGGIRLNKNHIIRVMKGDGLSNEDAIYISYPWLIDDAMPGNRILIDDGLIQLNVEEKKEDFLLSRVIEGGLLKDNKGVNLPRMEIRTPPFTEKDRRDLLFGMEEGVDYIAMSFVRNAADIINVKNFMEEQGRIIPIIAKIEKEEAIKDIENILEVAEGIMIARGDLGVEMPLEEIPLYQKMLIKKANDAMKIVITATQMLESMTQHSRPTRAETTDVANAVLDGSDALMLSAETSAGKFPVDAVKVMDTIITFTERSWYEHMEASPHKNGILFSKSAFIEKAIAKAAAQAAMDTGAKVIVAFTRTGFTARLISKFRPETPIVAFSSNNDVVKRMSIYRGVEAYYIRNLIDTDDMIREVNSFMLANRLLEKGDKVILVAGHPVTASAKTNMIKVHVIE
ncbi:MAG TPA: pyruvate kinase [Syntrophorhabdaceae bacterium]|nr:pyruvate kinase [Syntrophorhabdaceae bacterium]